jgi:DNA-binding GntR family transcriptional regulator
MGARSSASSLTARIYAALKHDIITCQLRPGQQVVEQQLAERYGASKTPIREALNTLRQEGYVQVVPRRAYLITPVSVLDVQHIFHVRLLLEPSAAELAAQRVTGEQLAELRRLSVRRAPGSLTERLSVNRAFHMAIAEASGNPTLVGFIGKLLEQVERVFHLGLNLGSAVESEPDHHAALVDALMKGDHHLAHDTMIQAIQSSRRRVMEALIGTESAGQSLVLLQGGQG